MNSKVFKWIKIAAALFLTVFIFSQLYSVVINPVTTDTVYPHLAYSGYETKGFIIRNEMVVPYAESGVLSYEVSNGGRVAKGGTIACSYQNSSEAEIQLEIEEIEEKIATLQQIQVYNDINVADLNSVNSSIKNAIFQVIDSSQGGKVVKTKGSDVLLESISRRQIITGETKDFNILINSLKAQLESKKASAVAPTEVLSSPQSGYVIYSVDGYENVFNYNDLEQITTEQLTEIKPNKVSDDAVCKIVSDYEWYIAAVMPFNEALNIKQGTKLTLKTKLPSTPQLTVNVKSINKQSVSSNAVVVFSCDTMNTELAELRNFDITVVFEEYSGLKVDRRAVRVVDGKKGVYVLTATQVKFVPIEILWNGENYCIVKQEASDKKVLRIYDEIVVKGKNLYDGKIIE